MLRSLKYFDLENMNVLEWMHNLARTFDNCLDLLVGRDENYDRRARTTSQALNIFRSTWPSEVQYLPQLRVRTLSGLTDEDIRRGNAGWCRRWLRLCGETRPADSRVNELRRRVTELRDIAARGERIPLPGTNNPLPWRLSTKRILELMMVT